MISIRKVPLCTLAIQSWSRTPSVWKFNALADAEVVQKLLEELPCTLATMYKIVHRNKTTRRAARAVTQLMQQGAWCVCVFADV